MNITLLCVGKIKEQYWTEALTEYSKRLSRYCNLKIVEVKDEKTDENASDAENEAVKDAEGERLLAKIPSNATVIALAINGKSFSSEELAGKLENYMLNGQSELYFIIGGSLGLSEKVLSRAQEKWSFSKLTFPHQMMRVIFLEQIYRGFRILKNEPYHK